MHAQRSAARGGLALHWQILIGLLIGGIAGVIFNESLSPETKRSFDWHIKTFIDPIGKIFLRLIFMVVIPLIFSALVLGVVEIGDVRKLGRIGLKTLLLTVVLSSVSVLIGVGLVNVVQPGAAIPDEKKVELRSLYAAGAEDAVAKAGKSKTIVDALLDIIPRNPLQEMVGAIDGSSPGGGMLAVMFFALAFGIAMTTVPQRAGPLIQVFEGVNDACMAIIGFAMRLAPIAVAALIFSLTATLGLDIVQTLARYVSCVIIGLALHLFGFYSLVIAVVARLNPPRYFGQISEALLTAFATSSSNATLPTSLRVAEQRVGIRRDISRFVLTVGATANQNGTALYEGVTVLFLAQVFGIPLTLSDQLTVAVLSMLAGIGTAGVPGGSLPLVVLVLKTVHVPAEGIAIILGVDRLLDMCRTVVNVGGDLTIAACVNEPDDHAAPARGFTIPPPNQPPPA